MDYVSGFMLLASPPSVDHTYAVSIPYVHTSSTVDISLV